MRDLARRLVALESRRADCRFRRVVIVGPNNQPPTDSDDIHIIRIEAAKFAGRAFEASPQQGLASLLELPA